MAVARPAHLQSHVAPSSLSLLSGMIRKQSRGRVFVGWTTSIHSTPPNVVT